MENPGYRTPIRGNMSNSDSYAKPLRGFIRSKRRQRGILHRTLFTISLAVLLAGTATAEKVQVRNASPSQNVNITADFFPPSGDGPFSAIVGLYTFGGVGKQERQYTYRPS